MAGTLMKEGYSISPEADDAETIVVNTCGFIDDAKKESIDKIIEMAELKKKNPNRKLVVTGCLVQRYKDELVKDLPEVDHFVGSGEFQKINEILKKEEKGTTHFHLPTYLQQTETPRVNSGPRHRAYLKISEGCKKRCAFCAIPLIRGDLQSRKIESIVSEAKLLVASGVREIIVISHDFTDFGDDLRKKDPSRIESPIELLRSLAAVKGVEWIRVLYLYPDGITPELVQLIKNEPKLIPYFDMPLQHINDYMLRRMNRKTNKTDVSQKIAMIRSEIPDAVIRTQFIVGFPGETEEHFAELLQFIEEQKFDRVGCFQYSPEEGTGGFRMSDQIDEKTKMSRYKRLMSLQKKISKQKMKSFIGKTLKVVVEGESEESELLLQGRYFGQAPEIDGVTLINSGEASVGKFVDVKITQSTDYDLVGEIIH
jgi:ribosomal protein S12 methylthiotransferase